MTKEEFYERAYSERTGCGGPLYLACVILLAFLLTGCRTVRYVPVEKVHTEYVTKTDTFIQKDSVHIKDSTLIHSKGDTVLIEKWHVRYVDKWKERVVRDTVLRADSIPVPYPVERELSQWEKIRLDIGGYAIVISLVLILIILLRRKRIFSLKS